MIYLNGIDVSNNLTGLNNQQLKTVVIDYSNPIIQKLQNHAGIKYIETLQGKTKVGGFLYSKGDDIINFLQTAGGAALTVSTQGAAAPVLPFLPILGNFAKNKAGVSLNENEVLADLQAKINIEKTKKDNTFLYIFALIILLLTLIYFVYD